MPSGILPALGLAVLTLGAVPAAGAVTLEPVADGVFVALQPHEHRFSDANVTVIVGEDAAMIVDAPANADFVRGVVEALPEVTDRPVRYVVNTHWHSDHTQGNALYRELLGAEVAFVGHESLADDVPNRAAAFVTEQLAKIDAQLPEAEARLESGVKEDGEAMTEEEEAAYRESIDRAKDWAAANRGVEFISPTVTYTGEKVIDLGGRRVRLIHFRAHTRGDTVILIQDAGVLVTGDLLDDLPYVGHGYPREWVNTLKEIEKLEAARYVPGHGPVFEGPAQLALVRDYIEALVLHAENAVEAGLDRAAAVETAEFSTFRERFSQGDPAADSFFDAVLTEAIERAWAEAKGEKLE